MSSKKKSGSKGAAKPGGAKGPTKPGDAAAKGAAAKDAAAKGVSGGKAATKAEGKVGGKRAWLVWAIGALMVVGVIAIASQSGGEANDAGAGGASPEEQKYIGRYLPEGYEEPKLATVVAYTSTTTMSEIAAVETTAEVTVPVDEVKSKRLVTFKAKKASGEIVPMIAYVKTSGRLFVGVSYCPPCEGELQRIETDGTLTCDACGTKRNLETQVGISGPCKLYPLDELPVKVNGDKIVLERSVLDGWTAQPLDRPVGG